mmetsp:Transcript_47964/g.139832  ORF Transcript_47964/g.139832 Transcript_47964/m.139832 type:complete len:93 (-) Transcript_47964:55-333(-)
MRECSLFLWSQQVAPALSPFQFFAHVRARRRPPGARWLNLCFRCAASKLECAQNSRRPAAAAGLPHEKSSPARAGAAGAAPCAGAWRSAPSI